MSTNTLSKEAETKLIAFFNDRVDPNAIAKALRQVNFTLAFGVMSKIDILQSETAQLGNSFYWLNELAEILDPYLEVE